MILVDSSVWIAYFNDARTPQAQKLDDLLGAEELAIGDLILVEVLQGFHRDRAFNQARSLLTSLIVVELGGREIAIQAARNFRALRAVGVTVRKTIDTVIATAIHSSASPIAIRPMPDSPLIVPARPMS